MRREDAEQFVFKVICYTTGVAVAIGIIVGIFIGIPLVLNKMAESSTEVTEEKVLTYYMGDTKYSKYTVILEFEDGVKRVAKCVKDEWCKLWPDEYYDCEVYRVDGNVKRVYFKEIDKNLSVHALEKGMF